jgi:DNA-binding transcriptional LysR family regulator
MELAREDYVFVAAPPIARRVRTVDDLRHHVLIEHDRSFPFLRYVPAAQRAAMKYRDVWFVGSTNTMLSAALEGFGVAIVSRYLARAALKAGRLRRIVTGVPLDSDYFRVVYRLEGDSSPAFRRLRDVLKQLGLR